MIPRPSRKTGANKICGCGLSFYCPKWAWNRKKYCSKKCFFNLKPSGKWNLESRKKFSEQLKGVRTLSEEAKRKIGLASKGKKLTDETKKKIGDSQRGEKSWRWKPNRDLKKRQERNDSAYQDWRKQVWMRDGFKCRIADFNCMGQIEAHHILNWEEFPELRYQTNNGITLCHAHHPRKRAEEKRLVAEFQRLVTAPGVYLENN